VMSVLSPDGASFAGGTFSGNPFSVALGHRVLDAIESEPGFYERLELQARRLAAGSRRLLESFDLAFPVTQLASIVDVKFGRGPAPRNYDEASQADAGLFAAYYHAMRTRGILLAPSPNEVMFLSSEHGPAEVDQTLAATEASLGELRERGRL
jgi:glutamate-1-semialdehyde 2,1-aminomutase